MSTAEQKTDKGLLQRLFESGAHFGFSKSRRHPTVVPYIYGTKNGNDILDIEKTSAALTEVKEVLKTAGKNGKVVVFVGTKDEVARLVRNAAEIPEAPVVSNRWIGGTITNFPEIKKRIKRLITLKADKESGELDKKYTKKERLMIDREIEKLETNFGGIAVLEKTPDMLVVVDPRHNEIAVNEANEFGIPVVGIMSSDCDVSKVTHAIMVNDSLTASVTLALQELAQAYADGKKDYQPKPNPKRVPRQSTLPS